MLVFAMSGLEEHTQNNTHMTRLRTKKDQKTNQTKQKKKREISAAVSNQQQEKNIVTRGGRYLTSAWHFDIFGVCPNVSHTICVKCSLRRGEGEKVRR